jgi:serine/threonine protein kinase
LSPEVLGGGRYTVERTLGGGGMAVVYLAQDRELDRPVAVKILAGHVLGDTAFRERFVREARMAARLSHPNVVNIYDTGEDDGRPFIVME